MLTVTDLHVSYGNIVALRGVSLELAEGEIVAVIGPNGAGKSTLLLTVAGVVRAKQGEVRLGDASVLGVAPEVLASRGVALVPEGRHIFGSLTVAENIALGATTRRDRQAVAADVERALDMFPILRERYRQRAGKLSGGEQQMLAIGRALTLNPRVLLLDEPMEGLAPILVQELSAAVRSMVKQSGIALVLVEQHARLALGLTAQAIVLDRGRVVHSSSSLALLADPPTLERLVTVSSGRAA
jgi:branched-chain amino acid transport system ATP-binding protein